MIINQQIINQGMLPLVINPTGKYRQAFRTYEKNGDISLMVHLLCKSELDAIERMKTLAKERKML